MISRYPGQSFDDSQLSFAGVAAAGQPKIDIQRQNARGGIFLLALCILLLTSGVAEARHYHHRHHHSVHAPVHEAPPAILGDPLSPFGMLMLQDE